MQDLADISTPMKLFTDAVLSPASAYEKRSLFEQRAQYLRSFSARLCKTANVVAFANARNARKADALRHLSSRVQTLTPQLVNAGTIRVKHPESSAAGENFENLCCQFAEHVQSVRDICDDSVDARIFLAQTEDAVRKAMQDCNRAKGQGNTQVKGYGFDCERCCG